MSLLPQINNEINSSVKREVTLPSKTYRLKVDSTALQLQKGNKTTVSGSEIKLTDVKFTQENKTSIKVEGSTTQSTRSGKNIYNVADTNAVTSGITVDNDGWITVTGDNTDGTATKYFNYYTNNLNLKTGTNYNIIAEVKNVSGTGYANFVSVTSVSQQFKTNFSSSFSGLSNNRIYNSINETSDEFLGNSGLRTFVLFSAGQSGSITFRLSVLEDTTITPENFEYEPYGVMPSPDYPSEIENVEGKNKFSGWIKGKGLTPTTGEERNATTSATSDYIAVDFNQNPNYYLSGLTKTLQSFVAAYNSNKEFLGRTGAVPISYFSLNSSSFTGGTAQGTGDIAYLRVTTYENSPAGTTGTIDDIDSLETQLEEGTVATPYVPYNSLEFKVEGKNRFDINSWYDNLKIPSTVNAVIDNSIITFQGTENQNSYFVSNQNWNLKPNTKYTISIDCQTEISGVNYAYFNLANASGQDNQYYGVLSPLMTRSILTKTFITDSEGNFYLKGYVNYPNHSANKLIIYSIQIELGETATDYEPYKSQVAYFPLGEEKLMEGSYLADDGIHHSRKQVTLDGTEEYNTYLIGTGRYQYTLKITGHKVNRENPNVYSSHFKAGVVGDRGTSQDNIVYSTDVGISFKYNSATTLEEWKAFVTEQYANGTPVIVEYELAEPEIVPYTAEQQEAYNQLTDYELFDGVNYITMISTIPGTLSLTYYDKNNINLIKTEEDRIVGFVDNLEAVKQSIYHILSIERYAYLIYDDNYGVEFEQYIGKDFDYIKATIENTLQEALLYDLRILDVSVDNIEQIDINKVAINFTVDTIYGNLVMEVSIDV